MLQLGGSLQVARGEGEDEGELRFGREGIDGDGWDWPETMSEAPDVQARSEPRVAQQLYTHTDITL
jgi:hypothetical protein